MGFRAWRNGCARDERGILCTMSTFGRRMAASVGRNCCVVGEVEVVLRSRMRCFFRRAWTAELNAGSTQKSQSLDTVLAEAPYGFA